MAENKISRAEARKISHNRNAVAQKIIDFDEATKTKSESDIKKLIAWCKEFEALTVQLQEFGYKSGIWHKRLNHETWEAELNSKFGIPKKAKTISKKTTTSKPKHDTYYIMLCWTVKQEFCICDSIIEKIQNYMKHMKIKSTDVSKSEFPDRVEFCEMFKLKCSQEVYETTLKSVQYILDISSDSIYDRCNIGIFGKKVE